MRIAIVGSRSVTKDAYPILEAYIPRGASEIVSGGASGADELAEEYARRNQNLFVCGYVEEGTITTPFDMRVLNELDRFHLVIDVVKRLPQLGNRGAYTVQQMRDKLVEHRQYIAAHGVDLPEIANWQWTGSTSAATSSER